MGLGFFKRTEHLGAKVWQDFGNLLEQLLKADPFRTNRFKGALMVDSVTAPEKEPKSYTQTLSPKPST